MDIRVYGRKLIDFVDRIREKLGEYRDASQIHILNKGHVVAIVYLDPQRRIVTVGCGNDLEELHVVGAGIRGVETPQPTGVLWTFRRVVP